MPANVNRNPVGTPQTVFGRKNRSQLERQAGDIAPKLTFDKKEQILAAEGRARTGLEGLARGAALSGTGLSGGFSGRNIRAAGTLGAQLNVEKAGIEARAGQENRANFAALLGAQGQEDQRRLAEAGQTGQLQGEAFSANQLFPQLGLDPAEGMTPRVRQRLKEEGFEFDEATQQFQRVRETLASKGLAEQIRAQGVQEEFQGTQEELQRGQLTGTLQDEEGGTERTLAGQQQDVAALQAQNSIELAERQRQDSRESTLQQLGLASTELTEKARQFDATLFQQATEFAANFGLSDEQFLENKRQFDTGVDLQNADMQRQMQEFNAATELQAAELFGASGGISREEVVTNIGAKPGQPGYRRSLDFNKDGIISNDDLEVFDQLSGGKDIIEGQSTLSQRQQEYQEARFESELGIQSRTLGINEDKVRNAFNLEKQRLDDTMIQFNSAFTGFLYEQGPDGQVIVLDSQTPPQPLESTEHQVAIQNLQRVEDAMDSNVGALAVSMGILQPGDPLKKLTDEQGMAIMSMIFANRAPASTGVSFGGKPPAPGVGWMDRLMQIGEVAGGFMPG